MNSWAPLNLAIRSEWFRVLGNRRCLEVFVRLIDQGPLNRDELASLLSISPATVSHHLAALREVGLTDRSANADGELLHFVAEDRALAGLVSWLNGEEAKQEDREVEFVYH